VGKWLYETLPGSSSVKSYIKLPRPIIKTSQEPPKCQNHHSNPPPWIKDNKDPAKTLLTPLNPIYATNKLPQKETPQEKPVPGRQAAMAAFANKIHPNRPEFPVTGQQQIDPNKQQFSNLHEGRPAQESGCPTLHPAGLKKPL